MHIPQSTHGGQRATWRSWFSSSPTDVLGTELRLADLVASAFTYRDISRFLDGILDDQRISNFIRIQMLTVWDLDVSEVGMC